MVTFAQFEEFILQRSQPQQDEWEGVDLEFDNIETMADDISKAMYSQKYSSAGTYTQVRNDIRCIAYFGIAKRFLQILQETEGHFSRITNLVVNTKFEAPAKLSDIIHRVGAVKTTNGRAYRPRDATTIAIKALFYSLHYSHMAHADDPPSASASARHLGLLGKGDKYPYDTIQKVNFEYLDFNGGGEIRDKRSATLETCIRVLAQKILLLPEHTKNSSFRVAQRVLGTSSFTHLQKIQNEIILDNTLTNDEIQQLYQPLPDHDDNHAHRNAIRLIIGDEHYTAENDAVLNINKLQKYLGDIRKIGWNLKDNFGGALHEFSPL